LNLSRRAGAVPSTEVSMRHSTKAKQGERMTFCGVLPPAELCMMAGVRKFSENL